MHPESSTLPRTGLPALLRQLDLPGEMQLPDGTVFPVGKQNEQPVYRVIFRTKHALKTPMTQRAVGEAYIKNDIDVEGDLSALFEARSRLREKVPLRQKIQFLYDHIRSATKMNSQSIVAHYDRGDDLYHLFADKEFRLYSHGLFKSASDNIEDAARRKLDTMWHSLRLKPGMHILDIGGGWGPVTQYCCPKGVHVTTLTLSPSGARYIQKLIEDRGFSTQAQIHLQDFYNHTPDKPYDAAVSLGSIEHFPDYRRFSRKVYEVLEPGGKLYLDGSAALTKYAVSSFTRKYIWPGTHTYMTVQDVMGELLLHGFEVEEVVRETKDYELTMTEWARRLDARRDEVVAGWGEQTYRVFRLLLWGGSHALGNNALQAYHVLAERTSDEGPRPGTLKRVVQVLRR